jgi:hypothetical protein
VPQVMYLLQLEAAQARTSGIAGVIHAPALQVCPVLQVLPQEPQLAVSVCRSLQVSGVRPQRAEVGAEHGQTVSVAMAVSVRVVEGVSVRVVAGTVVKTVSVKVVIVVMDIVAVVKTASVKVVVVVASSVAGASPRQPHAAESASQAKPVRSAVGAVSHDGRGAGVGVGVGVVSVVRGVGAGVMLRGVVEITEDAVGLSVGCTVELLETSGVEILEEAVTPPVE